MDMRPRVAETWREEAPIFIARATADLPADASLDERKRALREIAWSFHGGTSWGQRIWQQECRKYLERHGQPPRRPMIEQPKSKQDIRLASAVQAGDIIFPFRSEA